MNTKLKLFQKGLSIISGFFLVANSFAPGFFAIASVYAQEVTPTPTVSDTPTPGATPTADPTPTPDTSITPTNDPTPTPTAEVTPVTTPEATVTPSPTEETTVTPTPTSDAPTPTSTEPPHETSPPTTEGQILDGASTIAPTPTEAPTPTVTPQEPEQGALAASVLEHTNAQTLDLGAVDPSSATLTTDKKDYAPTDTAIITGTGFKPNHGYTLEVTSQDPPPVDFKTGITTNDKGDFVYAYQLDGNYRPNYAVFVKQGEHVVAQTAFTDSSTDANFVDFAQCANDPSPSVSTACPGGWINGILNSSNSHYSEDTVVPQRAEVELPSGGALTGRTITIKYQARKGTIHAYDSMATWNYTQTTADRNQGLSAGDQVSGTSITCSIPSDPTVVADTGAGSATSGHQLAGQVVTIYGTGTSTSCSVSVPSHDNAAGPGDDYASVTITYNVSSLSSDRKVQFLFGGHTAASTGPRGWGAGLGSSFVSGGPYHFKWDKADGKSIGERDNQIQSAALVTPDSPTVSTNIHLGTNHTTDVQNTTIAFGSTIHDKATVSNTGTNGTPQGNVAFTFYNNGTCNGGGTSAGTVALSSGVADPSTSEGPLSAGNYSFKASYTSSDTSKWNNAVGPCESVTVGQGTSTVATTLHKADESTVTVGSTVPFGTTMHDLATVTVSGSTAPTGNVAFTFYTNSACTGEGSSAGSIALDGSNPGVAHPSTSEGPLNPGNFAFKASWAGDNNYTGNTSTCENFTVSKLSSSTSTAIHDPNHGVVTSVDAGSTVHDSAAVTGSGPTPTGNVSFTFFPNGSCTRDTGSSAGTTTLSDGIADPSNSEGPLSAGSYSFQATYAGNSTYNGSTSTCEPLTVNQLTPTVVTNIHNADHQTETTVDLGSTVHDSATVSGAFGTPTGTVDFTFFPNDSCTNDTGSSAGTVALDKNGVADPSNNEGPLAAGSYSFKAHYNGDTNYVEADGECEPLTVNKAQLGITTEVHDSNHTDQTSQTVPLASVMHDTATVTGGVEGFPTPDVSFSLTSNFVESCAEGDSVANDGTDAGNGALKSADSSALGPGNYAYRATVDGNDNYFGATSSCEPFTVSKADTSTSTEVHNEAHEDVTDSSIPLGSVVHDNATVGGQVGEFAITGNVTYDFYDITDCDGKPFSSETVAVGNESSATSALAAGNYGYVASYLGDDNYNASVGSCEPFTVEKGTPDVTTTIHDANHNAVGPQVLVDTVHDSASVSGIQGFDPTGTVNFTFFDNDSCRGEDNSAGSNVTLTNGVADPSDSQGPLSSGQYSFQARYNGDSNYDEKTSACEPLTITKVVVHKEVDTDGNGTYDGGDKQANDIGFRWGLDEGENNRLMWSDAIITPAGNKHSVSENALPGYVYTGWFDNQGERESCENPVSTDFPSFTVVEGQSKSITLCNKLQNPILTISKQNDTGGADKSPGDSVLYTITVESTQSAAFNVLVTDLLPDGFKYHAGSWTSNSTDLTRGVGGDLKAGGITTEPTYASPGVWKLGNMSVGEIVTLTYIADISGSQNPGLYKDVAWAYGCKTDTACSVGDSGSVLSQAVNPGFVDTNFVGTEVNVVKGTQNSASINVEHKEEVLGASTELPATGSDTKWIILAALLTISGVGFIIAGRRLRKHYA